MTPAGFRRGNLRLALWDSGGGGAPVVFQHGLCGEAAQPGEVFPDDPRFRRITLECRAHGLSEAGPLEELSIATFTDDLAAMLDARQLPPAVVGGISMGAAIALRLAVRRPELVRALVLARPAWLAAASPENMGPMALVGRLLGNYAPDEARALFEASEDVLCLNREAPDNLASLRGFFSRAPQAVTAALLTRIAADGPGIGEADICRLDVPALIIGHERDVIHPFAYAETLGRMIPAARLRKITPKAEDLNQYRHDFQECLRAFLEGLAA